MLHELQLSQDHLGVGGGYFDVGAQAAAHAPMDVSLDMAWERGRSRGLWARGEAGEEGRVREEMVGWLLEELLVETAAWAVGVVGGRGGEAN